MKTSKAEYLQLEIARLLQSSRELGFTMYSTLGVIIAGVYGLINVAATSSKDDFKNTYLLGCLIIFTFLLVAVFIVRSMIRGNSNKKIHFSSNITLSYLGTMSTGVVISIVILFLFIWIYPISIEVGMNSEDVLLQKILLVVCIFSTGYGFLLWRRNIDVVNNSSVPINSIFNMNYLNSRFNSKYIGCISATSLSLMLLIMMSYLYIDFNRYFNNQVLENGFKLGASITGIIVGFWLLFDLLSRRNVLRELKEIEQFLVFRNMDESESEELIEHALYKQESWEYIQKHTNKVVSLIADNQEDYPSKFWFLGLKTNKISVLNKIRKRILKMRIYFGIVYNNRYENDFNNVIKIIDTFLKMDKEKKSQNKAPATTAF